MRLWNSVPRHIREASSVFSLKKHVNNLYFSSLCNVNINERYTWNLVCTVFFVVHNILVVCFIIYIFFHTFISNIMFSFFVLYIVIYYAIYYCRILILVVLIFFSFVCLCYIFYTLSYVLYLIFYSVSYIQLITL